MYLLSNRNLASGLEDGSVARYFILRREETSVEIIKLSFDSYEAKNGDIIVSNYRCFEVIGLIPSGTTTVDKTLDINATPIKDKNDNFLFVKSSPKDVNKLLARFMV